MTDYGQKYARRSVLRQSKVTDVLWKVAGPHFCELHVWPMSGLGSDKSLSPSRSPRTHLQHIPQYADMSGGQI